MLIIYRSYGGENLKGRPAYYNKTLCLLSLIRAAEAVPGIKLVFLNDGPMPEGRLRLMQQAGEVRTLDSVGMRGSYTAALKLAWASEGPGDEIIHFAEDDYVYQPTAFAAMEAAGRELAADYFAIYASVTGHPVGEDSADVEDGRQWTPPGWVEVGPYEADGVKWQRAVSTTSTFAGRRKALRQDRSIFIQGLLPHRHSLRDHDTCVVLQGYEVHTWKSIGRELTLRGEGADDKALSGRLKDAAIAPFKAALNVRAHRRRDFKRVMISPVPNQATHVEAGWIAPDTDWAQVAEDTTKWAAERGLA